MPGPTRVGVDTPQMEAFTELMRAQDVLGRRLDTELQDACGLGMTEYWVLLNLRYAPEVGLPVGDLACHAHLTKSGVTRLVDRMEAAGTVERSASQSDRRSVHAKITEIGRSELRKAWAVHRRGIDEHFGEQLSGEEAATLRDLLRKVLPT